MAHTERKPGRRITKLKVTPIAVSIRAAVFLDLGRPPEGTQVAWMHPLSERAPPGSGESGLLAARSRGGITLCRDRLLTVELPPGSNEQRATRPGENLISIPPGEKSNFTQERATPRSSTCLIGWKPPEGPEETRPDAK